MMNMTIKRVLTIQDKNYNEEFEVTSKSGIFIHDNIIVMQTTPINYFLINQLKIN